MAFIGDNPLLKVKSILEALVLDERKWAKVPHLPTDAVLIDMEDTVIPARKLEARAAVVAALADREYFGGRLVLSRPNGLDTEWGHDDTVALAKARAENVILPMITGAADVLAYQELFHAHDADPNLIPGIETAGGVGNVEAIAAIDRVAGFAFGEGDLTAQMGLQIFEPDGSVNPLLAPARARVYLAAAATNCAVFDIAFLHDLKDLDELRARASQLARMGATAMFALYPPHVPVINDLFTPGADAVEYARAIVEAFDKAKANGDPAVQLPNGKAVLIHDYKKAQRVLARVVEAPA
jgi:citrate lyase beta subunit